MITANLYPGARIDVFRDGYLIDSMVQRPPTAEVLVSGRCLIVTSDVQEYADLLVADGAVVNEC